MGKIIIYLKQSGGKFTYRDSESHHGQTITTNVDAGDIVYWKLDTDSGISDIRDIKVSGSEGFFRKGPVRDDYNKWHAVVNEPVSGEITYQPVVTATEAKTDDLSFTFDELNGTDGDDPPPPPIIKPRT